LTSCETSFRWLLFLLGSTCMVTCRQKEPPPSTHRFNKERDIARSLTKRATAHPHWNAQCAVVLHDRVWAHLCFRESRHPSRNMGVADHRPRTHYPRPSRPRPSRTRGLASAQAVIGDASRQTPLRRGFRFVWARAMRWCDQHSACEERMTGQQRVSRRQ
jgi:hypothetical protein